MFLSVSVSVIYLKKTCDKFICKVSIKFLSTTKVMLATLPVRAKPEQIAKAIIFSEVEAGQLARVVSESVIYLKKLATNLFVKQVFLNKFPCFTKIKTKKWSE